MQPSAESGAGWVTGREGGRACDHGLDRGGVELVRRGPLVEYVVRHCTYEHAPSQRQRLAKGSRGGDLGEPHVYLGLLRLIPRGGAFEGDGDSSSVRAGGWVSGRAGGRTDAGGAGAEQVPPRLRVGLDGAAVDDEGGGVGGLAPRPARPHAHDGLHLPPPAQRPAAKVSSGNRSTAAMAARWLRTAPRHRRANLAPAASLSGAARR